MKEMLRIEICPVCHGAHSIYQCTVFGAWNVSRRYSVVHHKHLCFNCLGSKYSIGTYNSHRTCRECKPKYHMFLYHSAVNSHPSNNTATQQYAVSQSAKGETSATSLHAQTEAGDPDLSSSQFPETALATVSRLSL